MLDPAARPLDGPRRVSIGLTLEARPRLTVAGREVPATDDELGISTLGLVAIGVVAVGIVGSLLVLDALRDASD